MPRYKSPRKGAIVTAERLTVEHLIAYAETDRSPLGCDVHRITTKPAATPDEPRTLVDFYASVDTPAGRVIVELGDWIVDTREGRFAYKPAEFEKLGLKPIEEPTAPPAKEAAKEKANA